jgi:hypothetical protein
MTFFSATRFSRHDLTADVTVPAASSHTYLLVAGACVARTLAAMDITNDVMNLP